MNKLKVFIVGNGFSEYINWFPSKQVFHMHEADLILLAGGPDNNPDMYGDQWHPTTSVDEARDIWEDKACKEGIKMGIPLIGVCKGAQLMSIQAGGRLVQHQWNPGMHSMQTYDGQELVVTSTHHQAQYPFNLAEDEYKILGWTENMCKYHEDGNQQEMNPPVECEIVFYPKINALGVQLHPEYLEYDHPTNKWMRNLLEKFINKKL